MTNYGCGDLGYTGHFCGSKVKSDDSDIVSRIPRIIYASASAREGGCASKQANEGRKVIPTGRFEGCLSHGMAIFQKRVRKFFEWPMFDSSLDTWGLCDHVGCLR